MVRIDFLKGLFCAVMLGAMGAAYAGPAQPIALKEGVNSFKVKQLQMRIVQGTVGSLGAHGFTTYTVYAVTDNADQKWMQLSIMRDGPPDYSLSTTESADSNVQSVQFYKKDEKLYALVAVKTGAKAPDLYTKKTKVELQTYEFNEDLDTPFMSNTETHKTRKTYLNADEAIKAEGLVN